MMPPPHEWAYEVRGGIVLSVHIQPNAACTECVGVHGPAVKIRVAAPPVDGVANEALRRFLADRLALPLRAVSLQSGERTRQKRVFLQGTTLQAVAERLGL